MSSTKGGQTITRYLALALLASLTACSSASSLASNSGASIPTVSAPQVTVRPNHGASSLPGGFLPCGWPSSQGDDGGGWGSGDGGGDGIFQDRPPKATCSVAISSRNQGYGSGNGLHSAGGWQSQNALAPADIQSAYGFPSGNPGMLVAVVDAFDNPNVENDLNIYRTKFGLGPCTTGNGCFRKVNQWGQAYNYPGLNAPWSHESDLDSQMVSAVCPHCTILLVEARSPNIDDLGVAVDTAVKLGARVVSNSYYAIEWAGERGEDRHYNHPGVAIVVSSGDQSVQGGWGGDTAGSSKEWGPPYYPATSPYVTAVGGTSLWHDWFDSGWHQSYWLNAAQGCSRYEPRPSFEPSLCATRSGVDMAAVADPLTGVQMYSKEADGWVVAGGTSVGAPIVAAAYALSGNPAAAAYSYQHRSGFKAVNGGFINLQTGLGSPFGVSGL